MTFRSKLRPAPRSIVTPSGEIVRSNVLLQSRPSKTRQSEKDNCDINKIMERFNRTGKLPAMQSVPPQYGDARIPDYASSLKIVKEAQDMFMKLDSTARKHFDHDPQKLIAALRDNSPENVKLLVKLNVLERSKPSLEELTEVIARNTRPKKDVDQSGNSTPT